MSHSNGLVKFKDGSRMFFEYDGTVDVCLPKLCPTYDEMQAHWREPSPMKTCTCDNPSEPVDAFTDYGNGLQWKTTACKKCGVITDCGDPYTRGYRSGTPKWAELPW